MNILSNSYNKPERLFHFANKENETGKFSHFPKFTQILSRRVRNSAQFALTPLYVNSIDRKRAFKDF